MHIPYVLRSEAAGTAFPLKHAARALLLSAAFVTLAFGQARPGNGGGGGGNVNIGPGGGTVTGPGGGTITIGPGGGINIGPGAGGGAATTGPRIVTDPGILVGETSQATVVATGTTTAAAPPTSGATGGSGSTSGTTYQWAISGGRITSDPTRASVSYVAESAGTVSLSVVIITNGVAQSTSLEVTAISPTAAGTITATEKVTTGASTVSATVPAAQNNDRTFRWNVSSGAITGGQGTNRITVRAGAPGLIEVTCAVTLQRLATATLRAFVVVTGDGPDTALTIKNGSGGGTYPGGSRVDIFADPPPPGQVFDKWTGNTEVLGPNALLASLAHTIATVSNTPATLTATYKPAPPWTPTVVNNFNPIAQGSPNGTTLAYHIPANPQGLVILLHETGSNAASWFTSPEQLTLMRDLVAANYGVAALNSANRVSGAWSVVGALASNPDASTLAAALAKFGADDALAANKPVFLLGIGSGAEAAIRFADQLVTSSPPRPIKGAILYCSTGSSTLAATSRVPQFFALAANDQVIGVTGNTAARDNSQLLAGRGVATAVVSNGPSPVLPARFRMLGLDNTAFTDADAQAVWDAVKKGGFLDGNNYVKGVPVAATLRAALPAAYQTRSADVVAQLAVAYAAQEFYSDANARVINFLNNRVTDAPGPTPGRLVNLSTRGKLDFLGDAFTLGFTLTGTQRAQLLIRGIGPTLARFGLPGALGAPRLEINQGSTLVATNEGWDKGANPAQIAAAASAVGAFPLAAGSPDTAVLLTLDPGSYTATIRGLGGTVGDVLAEVYDVSRNSTRLTNLSTLGRVSSEGELVIPGIVVAGNNPRTLVVRAVGPGLSDVGFSADAVLGNPRISILTTVNGVSQTVATNNNWTQATGSGDAATLSAVFPAVGAFPLKTTNGDAAILDALAPGTYTLQAGAQPLPTVTTEQGPVTIVAPNQVGSVLVEIYEVP